MNMLVVYSHQSLKLQRVFPIGKQLFLIAHDIFWSPAEAPDRPWLIQKHQKVFDEILIRFRKTNDTETQIWKIWIVEPKPQDRLQPKRGQEGKENGEESILSVRGWHTREEEGEMSKPNRGEANPNLWER